MRDTRPSLFLLLVTSLAVASCTKPRKPENTSFELPKMSYGTCDPQVQNVQGTMILQLLGPGCFGIQPSVIENVNQLLSRFPNTSRKIEERISRRDSELVEVVPILDQWAYRYVELNSRLEKRSSEQSAKAAALLRNGDLEGVTKQLNFMLRQDLGDLHENGQIAADNFNLGQSYELQFQSLNALPFFEKASSIHPEVAEYSFSYASALAAQNQLGAAVRAYGQVLKSEKSPREVSPSDQPIFARNWRALGDLYARLLQPSDAQKAYDESLRLYRRLAKDAPEVYQTCVSAILNRLGQSYVASSNWEAAQKAYQEALTLDREMARGNPIVYQLNVVQTLTNLGNLYRDTEQSSLALPAYQEALRLDRNMAAANPDVYQAHVVSDLNDLAIFYRRTLRVADAEEAFQEALAITRDRANDDAATYKPLLATTLYNMANLYSETDRKKAAAQTYREALSIWRDLAHSNPTRYRPALAEVQYSAAVFDMDAGRAKEAEQALLEVCSTYEELQKQDPADYQPRLALAFSQLGSLREQGERTTTAEENFKQALTIYRGLANASPQTYRPLLAKTLNSLGNLYAKTRRIKEGEQSFREALAIRWGLEKVNPTYQEDVSTTLHDWAAMYKETGSTKATGNR